MTFRLRKHTFPWITSHLRNCLTAMSLRQILAHSVTLVPVNASFTLLEIDRIRRQIPVHNGMAVMMKIQTFLAHRCCCQYEGPKWRVERLAHLFCSSHFFHLCLFVAKTNRKMTTQPLFPDFYFLATRVYVDVIDTQG